MNTTENEYIIVRTGHYYSMAADTQNTLQGETDNTPANTPHLKRDIHMQETEYLCTKAKTDR
ncbi:MAG: hypothetical protein PHW62_00390 [Candidatus Ratteibacteria bacterium]|nr:hypothetical protein [Candidatus Ratteibacteria bacterium]